MASTVTKLIAFGNKTNGRDKLCRLFQYSFRGLSDLLDRLDSSPAYVELIKRFKKLDRNISTARKLLRLGKSLEMIYQAKQALHIQDIVIQTCVTLSRIASACFLFLDHIIWLQRAKAINIDIKPISDISNQFWLLSTAINLVRNIYDWNRIYAAQQLDKRRRESARIEQPPSLSVALDTVKNLCDILIPLNGLGHIQVSGVVQGATGVVSSIIGIATVWDDNLKCLNK